jgi:RNA-directed DNA polymerase
MDLSRETAESIAQRLDMSTGSLRALARKAPSLYRSRKELKKSGKGFRTIEVPYPNLKAVQRKLLDKVLSKLSVSTMLFGGKGSSPRKAVEIHTKKPLVITMDIMDFFPSVKKNMVRHALLARGAEPEVAKLLTRLTTHRNHVPHGAPTSPYITRMVLHPVAEHIERLISGIGHNADASIYVDDLTLSGPNGLERLQNTIVNIFERHHFHMHPDKIRIMRRNTEQVSLGVKLNDGIDVPIAYLDAYEQARKKLGPHNTSIKGKQSYIRHLNPQAA